MVTQEVDYTAMMAGALKSHKYDEAIELWWALWNSGCRDSHKWVKIADVFEPYNIAHRTFPLLTFVALELGLKNIWLLVVLGRMGVAAGQHEIGLILCREALARGVTDPTKWHLIRCMYIANVALGRPEAALDVFMRSFSLLPFSCAATLPVKYDLVADFCDSLQRHDLALVLRKGKLPDELLDTAELSLGTDLVVSDVNKCQQFGTGVKLLTSMKQDRIQAGEAISINGILPVEKYFNRTNRPAINFYELTDTLIIGQDGAFFVMTPNREILKGISNVSFNKISVAALSRVVDEFQDLAEVPEIDSIGLMRDPFPTPNYCHFILDQISRLYFFEQCSLDLSLMRFLGPDIGTAFQREVIEMLGLRVEQFLPTAQRWAYRCKRLYVADCVAESYTHPAHLGAPWATGYIRRSLMSFDDIANGLGAARIYISRQNANGRRVKNNQELEGLLSRHGFATVELEKLSVKSQIDLFSRASHVIAPHGAGLTNIVFCPADAHVLEIFQPFYGSGAYYYIARGLGLNYQVACDESVDPKDYNPHRNFGRADLVAPIDAIERWLQSCT